MLCLFSFHFIFYFICLHYYPFLIYLNGISACSDPNSILGGVRLPPDTEIIKYTSSIVGPKVPGTTNRGRKKTISLDPPLVSVHPSTSLERSNKRLKTNVSSTSSIKASISSILSFCSGLAR